LCGETNFGEEARSSAKKSRGVLYLLNDVFERQSERRRRRRRQKKTEEARDARARERGGDHGFFLFPEEGEEQAEEE
jgi:hypothetical protein